MVFTGPDGKPMAAYGNSKVRPESTRRSTLGMEDGSDGGPESTGSGDCPEAT